MGFTGMSRPQADARYASLTAEASGALTASAAMPGRVIAGRLFKPGNFSAVTASTFSRVLQLYRTTSKVQFVFSNVVMQGSPQENSAGAYTLKASVIWGAHGTGLSIPITFAGTQSITVAQYQTVVSDPVDVDFAMVAGSYFIVRSYVTSAGTFLPYVADTFTQDGKNEGYLSGDFTDGSNSFGGATSSVGFGPTAVIGWPQKPASVPDVFITGDSIAVGTNWENTGYSFLSYALHTAQIGCVSGARSGETLLTVVQWANSKRRVSVLGNGRTHAICEYPTNDIGSSTLAVIKANLLLYWGYLALRGMKVWQTTILPRNASTDSFQTLGNQTLYGGSTPEGVRLSLNQWLRAPASAGAGNSAMLDAAGNLTGIFDTDLLMEVNSDNSAITINTTTGAISNGVGGFSVVDTTSYDTGTVTSIPTSQKLADTTKAWTTNQWTSYSMVIVTDTTTPAAAGQVRLISGNTATQLTTSTAWTTTPSTAATYKIVKTFSWDGIHPTELGHRRIAAAIDTTKLVV